MAERTSKGQFGKGNRAALRHGGRCGLLMARLPKGCSAIGRSLSQFRLSLEAAYLAANGGADGTISVVPAALINTAVRCEQRARVLGWWAGVRAENMTDETFVRIQTDITSATNGRDAAISKLLGSSGAPGVPHELAGLLATLHDSPAPTAAGRVDHAAAATPAAPPADSVDDGPAASEPEPAQPPAVDLGDDNQRDELLRFGTSGGIDEK